VLELSVCPCRGLRDHRGWCPCHEQVLPWALHWPDWNELLFLWWCVILNPPSVVETSKSRIDLLHDADMSLLTDSKLNHIVQTGKIFAILIYNAFCAELRSESLLKETDFVILMHFRGVHSMLFKHTGIVLHTTAECPSDLPI